MIDELILHIGTEKTATTYLQEVLNNNRAALEKNGISYPDLGYGGVMHSQLISGVHRLEWGIDMEFFSELPDSDSLWEDVYSIANSANGINKLILSSEHFSSRLRIEGIGWLKERISKIKFNKMRILYVVRDPIDFFTSWYSTHIKSGGSTPLEEVFSIMLEDAWIYNHDFIINNWKSEFEDIADFHVHCYEEIVSETSIENFCKQSICCNKDLDLDMEISKGKSNVSWGRGMIEFSMRYNQVSKESFFVRIKKLNLINSEYFEGADEKFELPFYMKEVMRKKFRDDYINFFNKYNIDYQKYIKNIGSKSDYDELVLTDKDYYKIMAIL